MALLKCPDCETEVSDKAEICPKCAYPISKQGEAINRVQTIEKTSKNLKLQSLIGAILILIGFWLFFSGSSGLSLLFLFIGIIIVVVARVQIWWYHE